MQAMVSVRLSLSICVNRVKTGALRRSARRVAVVGLVELASRRVQPVGFLYSEVLEEMRQGSQRLSSIFR